jgi:hypothetical protein
MAKTYISVRTIKASFHFIMRSEWRDKLPDSIPGVLGPFVKDCQVLAVGVDAVARALRDFLTIPIRSSVRDA